MNYCWIMTHHIRLSQDAPLEMRLCTNAGSQWAAWCVQLSALSLEMPPPAPPTTASSTIMHKPHETLLYTHSGVIIHPVAVHPSSPRLCVQLSASGTQHIPPTVAFTADWAASFTPHPTPLSATGDCLLPNWWKEEPELLNGYFVIALIVLNVQL